MKHTDILEGIVSVLRDQVGYKGAIEGKSRLHEDLQLDSLQMATFVVEAENFFALSFDDDAERRLTTVDDVVAYVLRKRSKAESDDPTETSLS